MRFRALTSILALLLLGSPFSSFALTFKQCQRLLGRDSSLRTYTIREQPSLTESELEILESMFERLTPIVDERVFYKKKQHPLRFKIPFSINTKINSSGHFVCDVSSWKDLLTEEELKQLRGILTKLLGQVFTESKAHPILKHSIPKNKVMNFRMFGMRYLIKPSEEMERLTLHRDTDSLLQSLIVLKRPEHLKGGNTIVAWPQSPQVRLAGGGHAKPNMRATTWNPEFTENQLFIFDGKHSFHGTTSFVMPKTESNEPAVRDILALIIEND